MKFPRWAPSDLVTKYTELEPKAVAETARAEAFARGEGDMKVYDPRKALEKGELRLGMYFLGNQAQLLVLRPLITKPEMESVWRSLHRRIGGFKPAMTFPYGSREQAGNLYGACMDIELSWSNLPMRTKAESRRYYESIANLALQLSDLLLADDHNRKLLDTRAYITKEQLEVFKEGLEKDDHEMWYGFDGYLDYLLGQLIQPLPYYLLQLHHRANEFAALPLAVKQPKSKSAKCNYFIEHLSSYFRRAYRSPLHAQVATVVSVVLGIDVDEDRVRALVRSRNVGVQSRARKKLEELKGNPSGYSSS
jgi:hypothetical protein